jgi:hypothetical protein
MYKLYKNWTNRCKAYVKLWPPEDGLLKAETYVGASDLLMRIQCICWFLKLLISYQDARWIQRDIVRVCLYEITILRIFLTMDIYKFILRLLVTSIYSDWLGSQ